MTLDDHFIRPDGANGPAMRAMGQRFVETLVATLGSAASRPPLAVPNRQPFPGTVELPELGVPLDAVLGDFERLIVPGVMNAAHPGYIGHMDTLAASVPIFAEMLAAGLNNNPLFFEQSPSLTRLEQDLTVGFARLFGLPATAGGSLTTAGTIANLTALLAARNRLRPGAVDDGLFGGRPLVVFVSELAHVSFEKAMTTLGLGRRHLVRVATDSEHRMDVGALRSAIAASRAAGAEPCAVVGTAGTTVLGTIDPLSALAEVCARERLWFHVDAAYGGALVLSGRERTRLAGIEAADSITFNPQKWMYVPKACAMILFRDLAEARELIRTEAPYTLPPGEREPNLGDHSIQGTRHADALKLWMTVRAFGLRRLGGLVEGGIDLARQTADRIAAEPGLALVAVPEMNIVGFGAKLPSGVDPSAENRRLQATLASEGRVWVSCPSFRGLRILRALMLNPFTGPAEIGALIDGLREALHRGTTTPASAR